MHVLTAVGQAATNGCLQATRAEAARPWEIRRHGLDPRAERKRAIMQQELPDEAVRQADAKRLSLRQVVQRWVETELKPHVRTDGSRTGRKDSGKYILDQFERRVFPALGETSIGTTSDVMARLHEKGYISDPVGKAKSVAFTEHGLKESERLLSDLFGARPR